MARRSIDGTSSWLLQPHTIFQQAICLPVDLTALRHKVAKTVLGICRRVEAKLAERRFHSFRDTGSVIAVIHVFIDLPGVWFDCFELAGCCVDLLAVIRGRVKLATQKCGLDTMVCASRTRFDRVQLFDSGVHGGYECIERIKVTRISANLQQRLFESVWLNHLAGRFSHDRSRVRVLSNRRE